MRRLECSSLGAPLLEDRLAYRITFSKDLMGVSFPVASITVRHARSAARARRAAELRLMRRRNVDDWRLCADGLMVENQDLAKIIRSQPSEP